MSWQMDDIRMTAALECAPKPEDCICRGSGWWLSDYDTWEKCGFTAHAGPHPEDYQDEDVEDEMEDEAKDEVAQ